MISDEDLSKFVELMTKADVGSVGYTKWPAGIDPVAWFAEMLACSFQLEVYGVATVDEHGKLCDNFKQTCLTGNGPLSRDMAIFYTACHNNLPKIITEFLLCRRVLADIVDFINPEFLPSYPDHYRLNLIRATIDHHYKKHEESES